MHTREPRTFFASQKLIIQKRSLLDLAVSVTKPRIQCSVCCCIITARKAPPFQFPDANWASLSRTVRTHNFSDVTADDPIRSNKQHQKCIAANYLHNSSVSSADYGGTNKSAKQKNNEKKRVSPRGRPKLNRTGAAAPVRDWVHRHLD